MNIFELNLPAMPAIKIIRTSSGRYAGERVDVKSLTVSYLNGAPADACFTVEVSSGAMIEVSVDDVELA